MPHVNNFYGMKTQKNFYRGGSKMLSLIFHAGLFHESNFILCMVKIFSPWAHRFHGIYLIFFALPPFLLHRIKFTYKGMRI
jgi:hypothetical protein